MADAKVEAVKAAGKGGKLRVRRMVAGAAEAERRFSAFDAVASRPAVKVVIDLVHSVKLDLSMGLGMAVFRGVVWEMTLVAEAALELGRC